MRWNCNEEFFLALQLRSHPRLNHICLSSSVSFGPGNYKQKPKTKKLIGTMVCQCSRSFAKFLWGFFIFCAELWKWHTGLWNLDRISERLTSMERKQAKKRAAKWHRKGIYTQAFSIVYLQYFAKLIGCGVTTSLTEQRQELIYLYTASCFIQVDASISNNTRD